MCSDWMKKSDSTGSGCDGWELVAVLQMHLKRGETALNAAAFVPWRINRKVGADNTARSCSGIQSCRILRSSLGGYWEFVHHEAILGDFVLKSFQVEAPLFDKVFSAKVEQVTKPKSMIRYNRQSSFLVADREHPGMLELHNKIAGSTVYAGTWNRRRKGSIHAAKDM